ncbi:MAG: hypothetical protein WCS31_06650 [Verrucomicrobiae bacterium]
MKSIRAPFHLFYIVFAGLRRSIKLVAFVFVFLAVASSLHASLINNWVSWSAPAAYPNSIIAGDGYPYNYATNASGTITLPDATVGECLLGR